MELRSCLYRCRVAHQRHVPKKHSFVYPHLSFLLDLDEIEILSRRLFLFSRNKISFYSFCDDDHLDDSGLDLKTKLREVLAQNGIEQELGRVLLLANPRVLGYVFNPLSVYYCYRDSERGDELLAVVMEVCNTFKERKAYVIEAAPEAFAGESGLTKDRRLESRQTKNFYVSPFCKVNDEFYFQVGLPEESLSLEVTTMRGDTKVIWSGLTGNRLELDNLSLILHSLLFPFITLAVISRIHLQALLLWLKNIPFQRKEELSELQTRLFRPHKSIDRAETGSRVLERNNKVGR